MHGWAGWRGWAGRHLDALDWIALVTSHIPDPGEHMVRYYTFYSNVARGKRRLSQDFSDALRPPTASAGQDCAGEAFSKARRASWARPLRQIYEVDPLTCSDCGARMEIVVFIDQPYPLDPTSTLPNHPFLARFPSGIHSPPKSKFLSYLEFLLHQRSTSIVASAGAARADKKGQSDRVLRTAAII